MERRGQATIAWYTLHTGEGGSCIIHLCTCLLFLVPTKVLSSASVLPSSPEFPIFALAGTETGHQGGCFTVWRLPGGEDHLASHVMEG